MAVEGSCRLSQELSTCFENLEQFICSPVLAEGSNLLAQAKCRRSGYVLLNNCTHKENCSQKHRVDVHLCAISEQDECLLA